MIEYRVKSGPLKITVVAETAYEAALEAIRWWGCGVNENHRRSLEAELCVRRLDRAGCREKRFPTFALLAQSEGTTSEEAWNQLLDRMVGGNN